MGALQFGQLFEPINNPIVVPQLWHLTFACTPLANLVAVIAAEVAVEAFFGVIFSIDRFDNSLSKLFNSETSCE
jgi:hypothetical protein